MRKISTVLSPTNWIYVLVHLVLLLLGFLLVTRADHLVQAIGSSLIAAGIAGWVILVYVIQSQSVSERLKVITDFGIQAAFDVRSVGIKSQYDSRLSRLSEQIDILGFGLKTLRQDYRNDFKIWKGRANVRILIIDPYFPGPNDSYSVQRDREERDELGTIREDVEAFLIDIDTYLGTEGPRTFSVRLYRCLPSFNLFRVDKELFWGPYLINRQSRNSPTFIVGPGPLFDTLNDHFDAIWDSNELSCSIEEYRASRIDQE
jgi:hypothetical protein